LPEKLLEHTYRFYQWQLARSPDAGAYLAGRGIHDPAVVRRMRIGYAPGASLRGYLARLGYPRPALGERGLIDPRAAGLTARIVPHQLRHYAASRTMPRVDARALIDARLNRVGAA